MISFKNLASYPAGSTLVSDDITEFHASRILLILRICGKKDRVRKIFKVTGLTKLAKLDFFVRYPEFFRRFLREKNINTINISNHIGGIESRMIRFHYGPWDKRYYQLLPFLEARDLISIEKDKGVFTFFLTQKGIEVADCLQKEEEFISLANNIKNVNSIFGKMSGSQIKDLVYEMFEIEVVNQLFGTVI